MIMFIPQATKRSIINLSEVAMASLLSWSVHAADNEAINVIGGGVSLTDSGAVSVTSSSLQLTKQVYDASNNCLASSPADASCNSSATSVTVPAGTNLKFLIFVRNATDVAITDVRFQDALDITGAGFTYTGGSLKYDNTKASNDTIANIYTGASGGAGQSDVVGAPDDFASYVAGNITVGAVGGQANQSVTVAARKTFAIIFSASKN